MVVIIDKFISYIDYFRYTDSDNKIDINIYATKEYLSNVYREYVQRSGKILPKNIKKLLSKTAGLTFFDDDGNATIYLKKIKNQEKFALIQYHEISHALNHNRFKDILDDKNDTIFIGKNLIDELFAHHDSNYCIKKEFGVSIDVISEKIDLLLDNVNEDAFNPYIICELLSLIHIYKISVENVKEEKRDLFLKINAISDNVEYLYNKPYISSEDCENIVYLIEEIESLSTNR